MRSRAEIAFRARQELANVYLLLAQPSFSGNKLPLLAELPSGPEIAQALRGSEFAKIVEAEAQKILIHRFPVLGLELDTGKEIRWRRDYVHGVESKDTFFRRVPYLDFASVGDHKVVWELNRHQHLVLLAQAWLLSRRDEYKQEVFAQLESWFEQNRFQRGVNWASALEVAFRALSWVWVYQFLAAEMSDQFRRKFLTGLYQHGLHLNENLSVYFSPNTHLLGEAVTLHVLGKLFRHLPGAREWTSRGHAIVQDQMHFQVMPDGAHFEQSTYYHVYALDFFLLHYLFAKKPDSFKPVLTQMAEYLFWLLGPGRRIAFLGDDDGGRLFHPYGERDQFGRASLATCGILLGREDWIGDERDIAEQALWWLGPEALRTSKKMPAVATGTRLFPDSGVAFLAAGDWHLQMDCGPFGWAGAGHSHSDTLSVLLSFKGARVFVDPGTYTYVGNPAKREWFRGSAAHNTVRIDGLNQGRAAGPFRWSTKPDVTLSCWEPTASGGMIEAVCQYEHFTHRRRVVLESGRLLVWDEIAGDVPGEHVCEQIWQLGAGARDVDFIFSTTATRNPSKASPAYGLEIASESLTIEVSGPLPLQIAMIVNASGTGSVSVDGACLRACASAWERSDEHRAPQHS